MTAWLFVAWVVLGAPAITLAAGTYLSYAFPITGDEVFIVAAGILILAYAVNLRGIRLSGRVHVAVVALIIGILTLAVIASSPGIRFSNFSPALPFGAASVGVAAALIVWSYLGYENVSNITEEFENPHRDFGKSVTITVLYLAVAFTVVGTGAYSTGGEVTPFAEMMSNLFGTSGSIVVSLFAVVIIFSTVNAYTVGMARVVYAAALDRSLPRFLVVIDPKTGAPRRALIALFGMVMLSLTVFFVIHIDIESAFLATSGAAILTYVIGSASGVRLLGYQGSRKLTPLLSLGVSLAIMPLIGGLLVISLAVALLGFLYGHYVSVKRGRATVGV